jgi:L-threonylcarbamoyladenylate synthase
MLRDHVLHLSRYPRDVPRVVRIDPSSPAAPLIAAAAAVLARGGLVAMPTETVYGLAARGLHAEDVAKIFAAKGRPAGHPVILHVDGEGMARPLAASWPDLASRLAKELWPGPLTIVVERASSVPAEVAGGLATVGLRAPNHPVALALIREIGEPLAAPSANAHTHVSPTTAAHVLRSLGDRVDLILDAGPCVHGIESTVVAVAEHPPRVLRPGAVSLERLRAIDPSFVYEPITVVGDAARASPGQASKHYAPRARVIVVPRERIAQEMSPTRGAIVWSTEGRAALAAHSTHVVMPADPEAYGRALFAALHDLDEAKLEAIVIERVPDEPAWWAIADRILRASSA